MLKQSALFEDEIKNRTKVIKEPTEGDLKLASSFSYDKKLLHENINEFLDNNKDMDFEKLKISFNWQDKIYTTYAAILFIIKE